MRSSSSGAATGPLLAALLALAGCGTWSNEDLRFYEALPTRQELHLVVPDAAAPTAAGPGGLALVAACGPLGTAETWLWAKPTSDKLNTSIDWMLGLVDLVRRFPPSTRLPDGRIWGPFDDDKHPGNEIRIVIMRAYRADLGGLPEHAYAFEARHKAGADPFQPILSGTFVGPSAANGTGSLALFFDTIWVLGMADADSPHGQVQIRYDRAVDPRTVQLTLDQAGFSLEQFTYGFTGYADGRGRLEYAFRGQGGDLFTVAAGFDAAGAGRGQSTFYGALGATGGFAQCWNAQACLVWVDDPGGYSCGRVGLPGGCSGGVEADCPAVPP